MSSSCALHSRPGARAAVRARCGRPLIRNPGKAVTTNVLPWPASEVRVSGKLTRMERGYVLHGGNQLLGAICMMLGVSLQLSFHVSLRGALCRQSLRVGGALRSGILHHLLVVGLAVFLIRLSLGNLLGQILYEEINHRNYASALPGLGGIGTPCSWRRGRGSLSLPVL